MRFCRIVEPITPEQNAILVSELHLCEDISMMADLIHLCILVVRYQERFDSIKQQSKILEKVYQIYSIVLILPN